MSFVDSRFHINTNPITEHKIPSVGHVVKNVLLGDEDEAKLESSLRQLYIKQKEKPDVECMFWNTDGSLDKACIQAYNSLTDHLTILSREWISYLRNVNSDVKHVTLKTKEYLNRAMLVHRTYRSQNPDLVDRELREEKYMLSKALNDEISRIRNIPVPSCERSAELSAICKTFKQRFADSCELGVDERTRCKQTFENAMKVSEQRICSEFVESIADLLE